MTTIRVYDGATNDERTVEILTRRGVWALHQTLRSGGKVDETEFTVSHVPSGAALEKGITDRAKGEKLLQLLPESWAPHAGFGPAGVTGLRNRKDGAEIERIVAKWRSAG